MTAPSAKIAIEGPRFHSVVVPPTGPIVSSDPELFDREQNGYVVITDTFSGEIITVCYECQEPKSESDLLDLPIDRAGLRKLVVRKHDIAFARLKGSDEDEK